MVQTEELTMIDPDFRRPLGEAEKTVGERSGLRVGAMAKAGRLRSQASPVFLAGSGLSAGIQGVRHGRL
jgi:hypothetical protein